MPSSCPCPVGRQGVFHVQGCIFGGLRDRGTHERNYRLTERETSVAVLMIEGASNKQIALALTIATETVKSHIDHILQKTNATNRTQAAHRLGSAFGSLTS